MSMTRRGGMGRREMREVAGRIGGRGVCGEGGGGGAARGGGGSGGNKGGGGTRRQEEKRRRRRKRTTSNCLIYSSQPCLCYRIGPRWRR